MAGATSANDRMSTSKMIRVFPPRFSKAFALRLENSCAFEVREAADGDRIQPGLALIAPGDYHLVVQDEAGQLRAQATMAAAHPHSLSLEYAEACFSEPEQ
jgi:chemotaxis response regulator CheB